MDFKSFPRDKNSYNAILVVIDQLSKQAFSLPCFKTTNTKGIAELYIQHIYCIKGVLDTIILDRGPQFISDFWREFYRILSVKLKLSTIFHPQTDGQIEIINQYINQRLRPFVLYYQDNWLEMLSLIDYTQLILPYDSIRMSPFQLLYGYEPRISFNQKTPTKPINIRQKLSYKEAYTMATCMHQAQE